MTTIRLIPREILREVETVLALHRRQTLAVYAEAEKIRQKWVEKNVALEDIIAVLVGGSGNHEVSVVFDPSEASHALLGEERPTHN